MWQNTDVRRYVGIQIFLIANSSSHENGNQISSEDKSGNIFDKTESRDQQTCVGRITLFQTMQKVTSYSWNRSLVVPPSVCWWRLFPPSNAQCTSMCAHARQMLIRLACSLVRWTGTWGTRLKTQRAPRFPVHKIPIWCTIKHQTGGLISHVNSPLPLLPHIDKSCLNCSFPAFCWARLP